MADIDPTQTPPASPPPAVQPPPAQKQLELKETPPPAPSKLVERATKLGFENVANDEEAFDRLAAAYQQQEEKFSSQIKQVLDEVRYQSQPQPEPAPATGQTRWWNPPKADLAAAAHYRTAEGWKPETPPDLRRQVEELERYRDNFARSFVSDPESALAPLLEQKVKEIVAQQYGQLTAKQQFEQELNANPWLWEKDPYSGQPTRKLSAEGQKFNELMASVEDRITKATRGVAPDKQEAFALAMDLYKANQAASKATQMTPEKAQEINAEKKAGLLGVAAPTGNRGAALPAPGQPARPNRNLTPGQLLAQTMHANGTFKNT